MLHLPRVAAVVNGLIGVAPTVTTRTPMRTRRGSTPAAPTHPCRAFVAPVAARGDEGNYTTGPRYVHKSELMWRGNGLFD